MESTIDRRDLSNAFQQNSFRSDTPSDRARHRRALLGGESLHLGRNTQGKQVPLGKAGNTTPLCGCTRCTQCQRLVGRPAGPRVAMYNSNHPLNSPHASYRQEKRQTSCDGYGLSNQPTNRRFGLKSGVSACGSPLLFFYLAVWGLGSNVRKVTEVGTWGRVLRCNTASLRCERIARLRWISNWEVLRKAAQCSGNTDCRGPGGPITPPSQVVCRAQGPAARPQ